MKVIVPCCGRSSRYPDQPPKWMLPAHDGRPMLSLAVSGLGVRPEELVVTVLREHDQKYAVTAGVQRALGDARVVVLDEPTKSQAETVARTLGALDLGEPFLVKDSDNVFHVDGVEQADNYVCVDSLNNYDSINPRNKSYLQVDHKGNVTNIREKVVISDLFCVGGYYFTSPEQFLEHYRRLSANLSSWHRELYISDVIGAMILDGVPFRAREVTRYQDWGTVHEWKGALLARKAYLVALDGFVFERGSEYFHPRFADTKANVAVVEAIREIAKRGHSVLYLSIRGQELSALTEAQMKDAGLPPGQILYGCPIASAVLVTAPHATTPFQTGRALELATDDANLLEKLLGER